VKYVEKEIEDLSLIRKIERMCMKLSYLCIDQNYQHLNDF